MMNGVNDAFVRNPSTWEWLLIAVLGVVACTRVLLLFGPDSWLSMGVMAIMIWITLGCLIDLALMCPLLGHFTDVLYWQFAASGSAWTVVGYWLVTRVLDWARPEPSSYISL